MPSDNSKKLIFAHINIYSISLSTQVKGNIDVSMVSETKIDNSFTVLNFTIDWFSTSYRLDRDKLWLNYNPNKTMICNHLDELRTYLDLHSTTYEKVLILGHFNLKIQERRMKAFCENYKTTIIPALSSNPHITKIQIILHVLIWFYLTHLEASRVLVLQRQDYQIFI